MAERDGVKEWFVCRLKCSFEILSEKYVANSCGRTARVDDVGRELLVVLCKIWLIVCRHTYICTHTYIHTCTNGCINIYI